MLWLSRRKRAFPKQAFVLCQTRPIHRVLVGGLPPANIPSLAAWVALVSERSNQLSSGVSDEADVIVWSEPLTSDYPGPTL